MSLESIKEKKERVIALQSKVDELRKFEEDLEQAQIDYYQDYFDTRRENFARLTDIPDKPNGVSHGLYDYGFLCVDTIGKITRDLIRRYERKDVVAKRTIRYIPSEELGEYLTEEPYFIVGEPKNIILGESCEENIIINYSENAQLYAHPTNYPVYFDDYGVMMPRSNYNYMFGDYDGLAFDAKGREYVKEIVYSIAYYQKQHNIRQLGQRDTWNVYERIIYKK